MLSIISLLVVVTMSILITRVATVSLTLTGLSREAARFQARSALSGTGFTTKEAENVVNHPVRRRIILTLMLLGNAGIITGVSTLILGFVDQGGSTPLWAKLVILVVGISLLWMLAQSRWADRYLSGMIERALKRYTKLEVCDYSSLMHLGGDYRIAEFPVAEDDWLADKTLGQSKLRDEGILVLGIEQPDGNYIGAPQADREIKSGDLLLVYGRASALDSLDDRRKGRTGAARHRKAVAEQKKVLEEESKQDETLNPSDQP